MDKKLWKKIFKDKNCGKLFKNNNRFKDRFYKNINYNELLNMRKNDKKVLLLDVRSKQEYNEGHLSGTILIPLFELKQRVEKEIPDKNKSIIVYCSSGIRSIRAISILRDKGYMNLYNLEGGLDKVK